MEHYLVREVRVRISEAARSRPTDCPIVNSVPKGRRTHQVPVRFRGILKQILEERCRLNANTDPVLRVQYYCVSTVVEEAYENALGHIRQQYKLSKRSLIELHTGWRLSAATLTDMRKEYRAKHPKRRSKKQEDERIGLDLSYVDRPKEYSQEYLKFSMKDFCFGG